MLACLSAICGCCCYHFARELRELEFLDMRSPRRPGSCAMPTQQNRYDWCALVLSGLSMFKSYTFCRALNNLFAHEKIHGFQHRNYAKLFHCKIHLNILRAELNAIACGTSSIISHRIENFLIVEQRLAAEMVLSLPCCE